MKFKIVLLIAILFLILDIMGVSSTDTIENKKRDYQEDEDEGFYTSYFLTNQNGIKIFTK